MWANFNVLLAVAIVLFTGYGVSFSRGTPVLDSPYTVTFDSEKYMYHVDERFASFTLDSGAFLENLRNFNTSNVKYQNVARGMAPARLRVGGTDADKLVFGKPDRGFAAVTVQDFDRVCEFCKVVGWNMSFDLNLLYRNNSQWNSSNAQMLMDHAASKGYVLDLELGNEADKYSHNDYVNPDQIGRDYVKLRGIMRGSSSYRDRILFGPSLAGSEESVLEPFLQIGSRAIDAVSVHHYFCSGHDLTPAIMVDPNVMDGITYAIDHARDAITKASKGTHVLWLAEAGISWSASAPNTTGFIVGFMWMDTLGMSAANNVSLVARQTYGSLVGDNATPTPEYWMTLLFKRLVGQRVLKVSSTENHHYFRIYAHCTLNRPDAVTFYYMNLYHSDISWTVPSYSGHPYELYKLTVGGNGTLSSSIVNLNGIPVNMDGDNVPVLYPVTSLIWPIVVPSLSYGFVVLPNVNAIACK